MKNVKFTVKRLILGLAFLALAVFLGVVLQNFAGPESQMWQRILWIEAVIGTGIAGLLCGFLGFLGILWGYLAILAIGVLNALPEILPDPWNRYYAFAYIAFLLIWTAVSKRKKQKRTFEEDATEPDEIADPDGFPVQGKEMVLVYQPVSGQYYQLFRCTGKLLCYRVGGPLKGIQRDLLQEAGSLLRPLSKCDFSLPVDQLKEVRYKELAGSNTGYDCTFTIVTYKKKYRLVPLSVQDDDVCMEFFKEWILENVQKISAEEDSPDHKRLDMLKKVLIGYYIYIGAVSLSWLFLDVLYKLFSVLAMLALPAIAVLYICFPREFTILEKTKSTKKASLTIAFLAAGFALLLRTLMDFNILQWGKLLIIALVVYAVVLVLLLVLTKEWRTKKIAILYLMLALLLYVPATIGQLNCTFDSGLPSEQTAVVTELDISTSSRSPDSYNVSVLLSDGSELKLETYKEHYESLCIGQSVVVYVYPGTFGVLHAIVD